MTQKVTDKGKHEAKSWAEKRAVTLADWEQHLAGTTGIGIPPLDNENKVRWGAIDVDVYTGLDLDVLNTRIQKHQLPLILCRSKSGGPHIFLFLQETVPAIAMIEKLDSLAGFLGYGKSEVFPKQTSVAPGEFGAWLNMPYFGGTRFLRYGLDPTNKALLTIPEFYGYVQTIRLTTQQFKDLRAPEPEATFPDGPPCLNSLFTEPPTENRNILLANAIVYAKKAFPEDWKIKIDEYNRKFSSPLGSQEVETVKKSYDKKDYRYQCSKEPLCNFCDATRCRKLKFGIGNAGATAGIKSLTKLMSEPPIFFLDVYGENEVPKRISLTAEQLQSPLLFQRRCMESAGLVPPLMKRAEWEENLRELYKHVAPIEVAQELTPHGQFLELLWEFLENRPPSSNWEDLFRGLPIIEGKFHYFRMRDLNTFLQQQRFNGLKQNDIAAILVKEEAKQGFKRFAERGLRYFEIPTRQLPTATPPPPLQPTEFETPY